ncbi:MAG: cytochrome c [Ferruginibacter sp.]
MKQAFFLPLIFAAVLLSCNNGNTSNLLSTNNLRSYFVTINSDSGYKLSTPKGAIINILPNSFDVPAETKIRIEIKEAYSIQDILLAGLSTESNGKPLKSAGMIYFGATVNNKNIKFLKAAQATIPSKTFNNTMQVYKGQVKSDSTINWINPQAVDTSPAVKNLLDGKALFTANCANCHKPAENFTGPPLAGARKRAPNPEWAYRFVNNVNKMIEYDQYARYLSYKYGSRMTQFNLKKLDIKAILDYCDNQALAFPNKNLDSNLFKKILVEPVCGYDTLYYPKEKNNIEIVPFKENISDTTLNSSAGSFDGTVPVNETNDEDEFAKKGYKQVIPEEGMYQFNIVESGWYNVDVLFNEQDATRVKLLTKVQSKGNVPMTVYLCIPKRKILMCADKHNNDIYLFHYSDADGYLSLVLNDDAIVFVTSSIKDKIYYGITKFKVTKEQTILIDIEESTKEKILKAFRDNNLEGIKLDIDKREMEIYDKPCNGYPQSDTQPIDTSKK